MGSLTSSYWLTRVVFLRCLAGLYSVAFLVAYIQNEALLGDDGLTPAKHFIDSNRGVHDSNDLMLLHPTLFWIIAPTTENLNNFALGGLGLSICMCVLGSANVPILFSLWALYFSIVNVGQTWYSFGWESQLLEIGFLSMFMVPLFSLRRFPDLTSTSVVCIWGLRWLLFRIMIGAGMIKIRGDQCWRDLTCMNYHYQTQPVPNPLSIYFHNNPEFIHRIETMGNHVVELLCPWLLLLPWRTPQRIGGAIQIFFQFVLIASGNLSFLNWLTALPAIACFDDASLAWMFSKSDVTAAQRAETTYSNHVTRLAARSKVYAADRMPISETDTKAEKDSLESDNKLPSATAPATAALPTTDASIDKLTFQQQVTNVILRHVSYDLTWPSVVILSRRVVCLSLTLVLGYLSVPVVLNVMSPNQGMNVTFGAFRIMNSYGAFGSVTKIRHEVILQGSSDRELSAHTQWRDFEFACKPGDVDRRPCWISPYHIRVDWLMWFAAFQSYQQCPWIVHLADKLLSGSETANQLLAPDGGHPFSVRSGNHEEDRLRYVRAELYEYQYASLSADQSEADVRAGWEVGRWWKRRHVRSYMPAVDRDNESVRAFLKSNRLVM